MPEFFDPFVDAENLKRLYYRIIETEDVYLDRVFNRVWG